MPATSVSFLKERSALPHGRASLAWFRCLAGGPFLHMRFWRPPLFLVRQARFFVLEIRDGLHLPRSIIG